MRLTFSVFHYSADIRKLLEVIESFFFVLFTYFPEVLPLLTRVVVIGFRHQSPLTLTTCLSV
jgi:hypothetical protein